MRGLLVFCQPPPSAKRSDRSQSIPDIIEMVHLLSTTPEVTSNLPLETLREYALFALRLRSIKQLGAVLLLAGACGYSMDDLSRERNMQDQLYRLTGGLEGEGAPRPSLQIMDVMSQLNSRSDAPPAAPEATGPALDLANGSVLSLDSISETIPHLPSNLAWILDEAACVQGLGPPMVPPNPQTPMVPPNP